MASERAYNPYDHFAEIHAWRFSLPGAAQNRDIAFYLSLAREVGGPILELACGWGRVGIPLARAGFEVTGLDSSERILAVGRQKAEREPPEVQARIRLLCGDMTDFDLSPLDRLGATLSMVEGSQRFRLVLIPFNSLQLLPSLEGQRKTIICAARHLVEGGRLALEVNPGFKNLPSDANEKQLKWTKRWAERNLTVMAYERVWQDRENQATVFDMRFELVHDRGDRECTDVRETLRWTSLHQMEQLLKEAGLRVISSYGDFRRSPVPRVEGRLVLVAAKE